MDHKEKEAQMDHKIKEVEMDHKDKEMDHKDKETEMARVRVLDVPGALPKTALCWEADGTRRRCCPEVT